MQRRVMLLNKQNAVVAEVTRASVLNAIDSGQFSLLQWRNIRYIYNRNLDNGEYLFFCEVGLQLQITNRDVKVRD